MGFFKTIKCVDCLTIRLPVPLGGLVLAVTNKFPESRCKLRCHILHYDNHVDITCGARLHVCIPQHDVAGCTSNNHIVVGIFKECLSEFVKSCYHISPIIISTSFSTLASPSSFNVIYSDNLSTTFLEPIGGYSQTSILAAPSILLRP